MKKKEISKSKQLTINLIGSLIAFIANLLIGFFLSPYIVNTLGVEANGFVSLANTIIMYVSLVTVALNSMAGRFITISMHRNNYEEANKYYNSVFLGNLIITLILAIPAIICIMKLENIINIQDALIFDVKVLFSTIFLNFFIWTVVPKWQTATFIKNKVYLQSLRGVEANLLKIGVILILFIIFSPHVYYIGIATVLSTIYTIIFSWYYKKRLTPELKINKNYFNFKAILELIYSGVWNTITQAGQMLLSGLDLLIVNLFIGSSEMGVLALAKTLPNIITSLAGTITGVFAPTLTMDYAKGDSKALKNSLKQGMKLTGILLTIPLSILIIYGEEFYRLWVPSQDAKILQILSILTCFGLIFTSGTQCLYNVFTVTNKIKLNSILLLISGIISTAIVFILLKTTNLGILAIAGTSSFINLFRNMIYTVPFTAKYLGLKWNTFFPEVITSVLSVIILTVIGYTLKYFIEIDSWMVLIINCFITAVIGLIINIKIVLNKSERLYLVSIIKRKVKRA